MYKMITEDIIRQALNESIDEFIITEGGGLTGALKSGFGKMVNGALNGVKMYMDWRTNGQWNQKYGMQPNLGNVDNSSLIGQQKEMYVLSKWFKYHANILYKMLYNRQVETDNWQGTRWSPENYIYKNITPYYFEMYAKKFFKGYTLSEKSYIYKYIYRILENYENPQEAYQMLSINKFYSEPEGKSYLSAIKSFWQKKPQTKQTQ